MGDPVETGITISTSAVGGALLTKVIDFVLGRHAKKLDQNEATLDTVLAAVRELKASQDLVAQELRADISKLNSEHAGFKKDQEKQDERINGVAGDHGERLHDVEDRLARLETKVDERLPRRTE